MAELLYKDKVYAIIGAAMDVYNHLGSGFGEAIYQEVMELESDARRIPNNPHSQSHHSVRVTAYQLPKTH